MKISTDENVMNQEKLIAELEKQLLNQQMANLELVRQLDVRRQQLAAQKKQFEQIAMALGLNKHSFANLGDAILLKLLSQPKTVGTVIKP